MKDLEISKKTREKSKKVTESIKVHNFHPKTF